MKNDLLVTAVLFTPLFGLIPIILLPKAREHQVKWVTLLFTLLALVVILRAPLRN